MKRHFGPPGATTEKFAVVTTSAPKLCVNVASSSLVPLTSVTPSMVPLLLVLSPPRLTSCADLSTSFFVHQTNRDRVIAGVEPDGAQPDSDLDARRARVHIISSS